MDDQKQQSTPSKKERLVHLGGFVLLVVPALGVGLELAKFIIMSCIYGLGPVWSGSVRMVSAKPFIRISNGDEIHGMAALLWNTATFVILIIVALLWWRMLIAITKWFWPSLHAVLLQMWRRLKYS